MSEQLDRIEAALARIEAHLADKLEIKNLGHRCVYDTTSGRSINVIGATCDPSKLNEFGYRVRL